MLQWKTTPNTHNSCLNHRKRTTQKAFLCNSFSVVVLLSPFISAVAYHATALMNCCRERGKPCANSYVCYFCPQRFHIIQRFFGGGSFCFLFFVPLARKKSKPKERYYILNQNDSERKRKKQHNSIISYCNSYHYMLICKCRIALYKNGHNNNGCNRIIKSHSVSSAIAHRVTVFLCSQLPIYSGCVLYRAQHIAVTYSGRCDRAST